MSELIYLYLKKHFRTCINTGLLFVFIYISSLPIANAITNSTSTEVVELKTAIQSKGEELQKLNDEINKTKANLTVTQGQGKALQKEVNNLNSNIKELSLRVKAGEITVEKLSLELRELNYNIDDTKNNINVKKDNVASLLRTIQQRDSESLIVALLKNNSLADSVFEAQNLSDLNDGLRSEINNLIEVNSALTEKLDNASKKKNSIEIETNNNKNRQIIVNNEKAEREKLLKLTAVQQKEYQSQLEILTKKQKENAAEIEKLEGELRAKVDPSSIPLARPGFLLFPVPGGKITQGYGATDFALATYVGKWHNAIDIGKYLGAEMVAAEDGAVVALDNQDKYCPKIGYGKYIVIKHTNGLTTLYGHMSSQSVKLNQNVKRGELIGYMGKTGWATGPHVHFAVFLSSSYVLKQSRFCGMMPIGADVDPRPYLII